MVASKHLAPTQCQALEAKAEELPPPFTFRGPSGGGACQGFLSALWAARAVFPANPSGGPRYSEVPSPTPRKQFFRGWGHVTLGTKGKLTQLGQGLGL